MARAEVQIPNDFDPRLYQEPFFDYFTDDDSDGRGKRAAWCMHRRAGKDLAALHVTCMLMHRRVGVYWHVFPTAEQGRKSIWTEFRADGKRIMENVFPAAIRKTPREWSPQAEMVVELKNGSIWRLMGSDKIEVVGAGPVGVVFSEYALAKPNTWELVSPMLRANGGWAAFVSTPRGNNHFKKLYDTARKQGWFHDLKTVHDTGQRYMSTTRPGEWIGPDEMMEEERADGIPEAKIRQEYLCDWTAANVGAVWGDLIEAIEKRGDTSREFEPDKTRAFTTWDLGGAGAKGDSTCFWLWTARDDGCDVLDYYENHGKSWSHYADEVAQRSKLAGVRVVKHWLPHDARAKSGLVTGVSVFEQAAEDWGAENVAIYPEMSLLDGIQAARWLLQRHVRFHPRCAEGVEALKAYHYEWDEDRKVLGNQPVHDWSSHGSDAWRGVSLVVKFSADMTKPKTPPPPIITRPTYRLDDLWATAPRASGRI